MPCYKSTSTSTNPAASASSATHGKAAYHSKPFVPRTLLAHGHEQHSAAKSAANVQIESWTEEDIQMEAKPDADVQAAVNSSIGDQADHPASTEQYDLVYADFQIHPHLYKYYEGELNGLHCQKVQEKKAKQASMTKQTRATIWTRSTTQTCMTTQTQTTTQVEMTMHVETTVQVEVIYVNHRVEGYVGTLGKFLVLGDNLVNAILPSVRERFHQNTNVLIIANAAMALAENPDEDAVTNTEVVSNRNEIVLESNLIHFTNLYSGVMRL
ncbi:hypothetical protein LPJ64_004084 [Coemansia asiatica]|uniref:Uncharacterized protein n=1 Tax=Coemansia asiatica TaxID=1052880 RepID=A0A9W7XJV0_9FUNG|nr:hypothetical protein LPJ64_004084 [Coemansia asiatica]